MGRAKWALVAAAVIGIGGVATAYALTPRISVKTDKTNYAVGQYILWTADNCDASHSYIVGAIINGNLVWLPGRDDFSGLTTKSGAYQVGSNIVGSTQFILWDRTTSKVAASTKITVF